MHANALERTNGVLLSEVDGGDAGRSTSGRVWDSLSVALAHLGSTCFLVEHRFRLFELWCDEFGDGSPMMDSDVPKKGRVSQLHEYPSVTRFRRI